MALNAGVILVVFAILGFEETDIIHNDEIDLQIANPASEYCINEGHELEIINGTGYCTTENSICEEWDYFHGKCD